jgi:hypothetical protein
MHRENEKAARQQGSLSFSRENSSNGGKKPSKLFWTKSYESKKQSVKRFLGNELLYFQLLRQNGNNFAEVFHFETNRTKEDGKWIVLNRLWLF